MSEIEKFPLESMSITEEQKQKLKQLFPEVFTEGDKIDWDKLRLTLGENVDVGKERFGMNWPGKADCFKIIQQPSLATLIPARDESVNFDTTENLFIEGDNLEVLKLLQKSYLGKIKMIYIDPPYNTGNDFIYPDNYSETLETYLAYTGQVDSEGRKFSTNTDTEGRFHSKWMNMMYPRLFLAKNLLRDDGIILISINEVEVQNLRHLCNEIFGEENFLGCISRVTGTPTGGGNKALVNEIDYILVYSKTPDAEVSGLPMTEEDEVIYDQEDEGGRYLIRPLRRTGSEDRREDRPSMFYSIKTPDGDDILPYGPTGYESRWICGQQKYYKFLNEKRIEWRKVERNGDKFWQVYQKFYLEGRLKQPSNLWSEIEGNKKATRDLKKLFDDKKIFDFPKPVDLIRRMIQLADVDEGEIILDYFAGSATTAEAVLDLNLEDKKNRKFICVQLPEPTDEKSEASKAGYKTIADIGKERIRRVIKKIENEQKQDADMFAEDKPQLDLGFKVFKLASSNFSTWNANVDKTAEAIGKQLELHITHISDSADQEAILYELLLKSGFELTSKIEKLDIEGKDVFSIGEGELLICLERELTNELIKAMADRKPVRVICLDEGFQNNDQLKTNAALIMKSKGVIKFQTV